MKPISIALASGHGKRPWWNVESLIWSVGVVALPVIMAACFGGTSEPTPPPAPAESVAPAEEREAAPETAAPPASAATTETEAAPGPASGSMASATEEEAPSVEKTEVAPEPPVVIVEEATDPTPMPTPPTPEPLLTEQLFLDISEPAPESIVSTSPVIVQGKTTPDALVSVNGETAEVDAQGRFSVPVFVDLGPNLVEVVAKRPGGRAGHGRPRHHLRAIERELWAYPTLQEFQE